MDVVAIAIRAGTSVLCANIYKGGRERYTRERDRDIAVATISRLLQIIGLFCRISSLLWGSFAQETYNLKELTNRSHPIAMDVVAIAIRAGTSVRCANIYKGGRERERDTRGGERHRAIDVWGGCD